MTKQDAHVVGLQMSLAFSCPFADAAAAVVRSVFPYVCHCPPLLVPSFVVAPLGLQFQLGVGRAVHVLQPLCPCRTDPVLQRYVGVRLTSQRSEGARAARGVWCPHEPAAFAPHLVPRISEGGASSPLT